MDLQKYMSVLTQTVTEAGLHHEVWWVFAGDEDGPKYAETMNRYGRFFGTAKNAHFVTLIVMLYRLYEKRSDTINIPQLLKIIKNERHLDEKKRRKLKELYENEARPLWIKVSRLRNEVFAHRSDSSLDDIFRGADMRPAELRELLDVTELLLNNLMLELNGNEHAFNLGAKEDALRLLNDLNGR